MKPSHMRTPRTMGECHFQTGYKSADPRADDCWWVVIPVATALAALFVVWGGAT